MDEKLCLRLIMLAKRQTVQALLASAWLDHDNSVSRKDRLRAFFVAKKAKEDNKTLNDAIGKLVDVLEKHGVEYVIVKGQTTASFYPLPESRVPGDIDVFVSPHDISRIGDIFKQEFGVNLPPLDFSRHQETEMLGGVLVEVHNRLADLSVGKHRRYWDKLYADCFSEARTVLINNKQVKTLDATRNILYTFQHLYFHLLVMGVGLRQLIDLAVLMHTHKSDYSVDELRRHLLSLGLYDAFCAIGWVLVKKLGLPISSFPFTIEEKHKKYESRLLNEIFRHGNFGKYNRVVDKAGILHTLETAFVFIKHSMLFFRLSPCEILMFVPRRLSLAFKSFFF